MAPEESVIEPSSLTKFKKLRLKDIDLLDMLINKTVEIAIDSIAGHTRVWCSEILGSNWHGIARCYGDKKMIDNTCEN